MNVCFYDENGYYTGHDTVQELGEGMTTVHFDVGYIKPHFNGVSWEEGATQEEIEAWENNNKIDICEEDRPKTNKELTEEQIKMQKIIADLEIESIINN